MHDMTIGVELLLSLAILIFTAFSTDGKLRVLAALSAAVLFGLVFYTNVFMEAFK